MKKTLSAFLILIMILSFTACTSAPLGTSLILEDEDVFTHPVAEIGTGKFVGAWTCGDALLTLTDNRFTYECESGAEGIFGAGCTEASGTWSDAEDKLIFYAEKTVIDSAESEESKTRIETYVLDEDKLNLMNNDVHSEILTFVKTADK